MSNGPEDRVRNRAYALWQAEGEPEGREVEMWLQAEREIGDDEGSVEGPAEDRADEPGALLDEAPSEETLAGPQPGRTSIERDG